MSYIDEIIVEELYEKIDELKEQLNSSYEHNKAQRKINQELQERYEDSTTELKREIALLKDDRNRLFSLIFSIRDILAVKTLLHGTHRERDEDIKDILRLIRDNVHKTVYIEEIPF